MGDKWISGRGAATGTGSELEQCYSEGEISGG